MLTIEEHKERVAEIVGQLKLLEELAEVRKAMRALEQVHYVLGNETR